jgi:hypothetical protein
MCRVITITVVGTLLFSSVIIQAKPRSHSLDEEAALNLLERTLKHDRVYAHRISLDCVSYMTEETKKDYFEFVLREKHDAKCGGAPETSPVVDRYRVSRRSGKIQWWEATEDKWLRYDPAKIKYRHTQTLRPPSTASTPASPCRSRRQPAPRRDRENRASDRPTSETVM